MGKSEPRMAMLKTLCTLCCTVATTFAPCLQGVAQSAATPKRLTSFCGFKAGEMKKNDRGIDKPTKAKTPFRKLREVRLSYSPKGKLQSIVATAFLQNAKPDAGRKELDLCCKDLEKSGIVFQGEWHSSNGGTTLEKSGRGDGVDEVIVRGDLAAKPYGKSGVFIEIQVYWADADRDHSSFMTTPVPGDYGPKDKKSLSSPKDLSAAARMRIKKAEGKSRKMILPKVEFSPDQTIINAVDFFNRAAKDADRRNGVPEEKCGFHFIFTSKGSDGESKKVEPFRSAILATEISLWDALRLACDLAKYKFEILDNDSGAGCYYIKVAPQD